MTKPSLKYLAGAAALLLLTAPIAYAGPDGTCEEETVASEAPAQGTPAPTATTDYTKIAQTAPAAGNSVILTASTTKTDAASTTLAGKKGDVEKKQTDSLPKER